MLNKDAQPRFFNIFPNVNCFYCLLVNKASQAIREINWPNELIIKIHLCHCWLEMLTSIGGTPVSLPSTEPWQGCLDECQVMQDGFGASSWWKSNCPPLGYNRIFFFLHSFKRVCIVFKLEKHGFKLKIPREVTCVHCATSIPDMPADADTKNGLYSFSVTRLDEGQTSPVLQGGKPGIVEELHQKPRDLNLRWVG